MQTHERLNGKGEGKIVVSKVSECSAKQSTLITGRSFNITVAPPFIMPVLAAFRVLIQDGAIAF